jgi:hypothetical protein
MKQYHEPITVEVGDDGLPTAFRWRDRSWRVLEVIDRWVLQSGWWTDSEEKRDYVLVEVEGMDGAATAVVLYLAGDGWMLGRVMA